MFRLTNEQRVYLGLELIENSWDEVKLSESVYIYFDNEQLMKRIVIRENYYWEASVRERVSTDRTYILPKTQRGKPRRLTVSSIERVDGVGTYFHFQKDIITIANYTTQSTYYFNRRAGVTCNNFAELKEWIEDWMISTTPEDLLEIKEFSRATRRHGKFKEGDFFRYSIDRGVYGYGRILLDYHLYRKKKKKFWDVLMGRPLVVKVYHIITSDKHLPVENIKGLSALPSQFIMDNSFFYGEFEIIGYEPLTEKDADFPIMYGRSISAMDTEEIIFQWGPIYKSIPLRNNELIGNYRHGIGFDLDVNRRILEECIALNSNQPYWDKPSLTTQKDLRNPKMDDVRKRIFKQFDIE
jgi:hypothetical protein